VDAIIARCPEVGDWSFPSNHATIASAAAVGLALAWRALLPWVAAMALLMVFSRVFVGVHYPRDVVVGLLLGAAVAWSVLRLGTPRLTALVLRSGDHPRLGRLLHATPPDLTATRRLRRPPLPGRRDPRQGGGR
jgi:undecaprenyl-diphosphatase